MLSMLRCCTNRMTSFVQTRVVTRKYMTVSEKMELLLKQRDHVARDYKLIYRDKNHTFVGFAYHSLSFMSWTTVAALGYLWYKDIPIQPDSDHFTISKNPVEAVSLVTGVISIFVITLWLRQRFVLRVYFSEKGQKYKAIFIGRVPFTCEFVEFPAKSLTYAAKDSAFPWKSSIFKGNGRKMYLFDDNFRTHSDFLNMLQPGQE